MIIQKASWKMLHKRKLEEDSISLNSFEDATIKWIEYTKKNKEKLIIAVNNSHNNKNSKKTCYYKISKTK